jgi:type II secretory pathway component PulF
MPNFQYTAKDKSARTLTGSVEAANENEVVHLRLSI